jgi:hypothetical protein
MVAAATPTNNVARNLRKCPAVIKLSLLNPLDARALSARKINHEH